MAYILIGVCACEEGVGGLDGHQNYQPEEEKFLLDQEDLRNLSYLGKGHGRNHYDEEEGGDQLHLYQGIKPYQFGGRQLCQ